MRTVPLILIMILAPVAARSADLPGAVKDTGPIQAPVEASRVGQSEETARDGGESFGDAVVIPALPYSDSGNTCAHMDDITLPCAANHAPDVVYQYTPSSNTTACLVLCGSSYDTMLGVFDSGLNCIACNDDDCGLQSQIVVDLAAGQTYYFVVDGYGTNCGAYRFDYVLGCIVPGACCFEDGICEVLDVQDCLEQNGAYQGVGTLCEPDPCLPVGTARTSWGRLKSIYR